MYIELSHHKMQADCVHSEACNTDTRNSCTGRNAASPLSICHCVKDEGWAIWVAESSLKGLDTAPVNAESLCI